jgi:RNA polymerase sigma factor (sigma-70 family)
MIAFVELGNDLAALTQQPTVGDDVGISHNPASVSISELTRGMVAGNEVAFRSFYEAYFPRLLRYLFVITKGDEDAARETLQVVLERVVRYIKVFTDEAQLWNWLTVVARTAFTDRHRKRRRYLAFLDRFKTHAEMAAPPQENGAVDKQLLATLDQVITALPATDRALLERKYYGGESVRDLAASLQTSEKAVESRLSRARRRLKELLRENLKHESD